MNNPELIILKISVSLLVLFGIYYFLLRKETTFRFIRFFLLFSLAASLIFPFIPAKIHWSPPELINSYIKKDKPLINSNISTEENFSLPQNTELSETKDVKANVPMVFILYLTGALILSFRFIINLLAIGWKVRHKKLTRQDGFIYVDSSPGKKIHSFFHFIFLPKEQLKKPVNSILEHEKTHARQLHSIDVLLIELLQIIFWFNPVIYLFKNAIVLNHEFLADEHAVKSGRTEYQQSLLEYCIENSQLQFTSGFNFNHIKKRITMMTKKSKKQNIFLKPIAAFTFSGFLFTALSLKEKPAVAMITEFETPTFSEKPALQDIKTDGQNSVFDNSPTQDPKASEKEIQLKKLMLKRDSVMKTMQLKLQDAQKTAQLKHQEKIMEAKDLIQKKMLVAQKKLKEKQKDAQTKMKAFQKEIKGKKITSEIEKEYEQLEFELGQEMEMLENELSVDMESQEASISYELEKLESEMEYELQKMEVELEHEMEALNLEIEMLMSQIEMEMEEK